LKTGPGQPLANELHYVRVRAGITKDSRLEETSFSSWMSLWNKSYSQTNWRVLGMGFTLLCDAL